MNIALCAICPDAKQRLHLDLVWSTWKAYAQRNSLPLHIITSPPIPEHFYWGKYFLLDSPELAGYDAVAVLDNDILINELAPSLITSWNPDKVGMADEREQFGWTRKYVEQYYAHYDLFVPPSITHPLVLNGGVLIYSRSHSVIFRSIYASWLQWRAKAKVSGSWSAQFRYANDQPHVGLALQLKGVEQVLDARFNRLWWSWWQDGGRHSEWSFKIYAKSSKVVSRCLPRAITNPLAAWGLEQIDRALSENHFLHFAGSKSPLHLLRHRTGAGTP